jgi:hypothetical protein
MSDKYDRYGKKVRGPMPLPVVLRGLDETGGKPRTIMACENAVERAFSYWFQAMGGL